MNDSKRERLRAAVILLTDLEAAERQDLHDTPDNIEHSEACASFRANLGALGAALEHLETIE